MAKKSVIAGEYVIEIADNGHVDVLRVPRNGKAVMREIAASKNFKIEPKWTNHQLGPKLIKEFGDGTLAEFGDIVMIKQPNGAIEISQKFSNVKASLREIASKIGFQYNPEWNGQMFGRKLVDYLIEHKEEADKILRTPNAKSVKNSSSPQETDELCVEKEDDKRNESASGAYDYYVLGISYEAEHILHVSKESLPSIEDINTNYDEFPPIEGDEITIDNLNDVFERYEGPLNFVQEACDYERRLNLTLITGGHLVKCASEDDDKWEAYHSGGVDSCDVDSSCMHLDYYNRLDANDLERQSSGELLLCSAYPVIGMSAFALRLPAGDSFEPERLKIKNDEDGSMFSVYYEDEPIEFLFVGDNDPEFADEANYKVFFDGSWIKPWETDE